MNKPLLKFREGKDRSLNRLRKREFYESQLNKLPNEFRDVFTNYNHRNIDGLGYIDENYYDHN